MRDARYGIYRLLSRISYPGSRIPDLLAEMAQTMINAGVDFPGLDAMELLLIAKDWRITTKGVKKESDRDDYKWAE
jgi:hypothetical protein